MGYYATAHADWPGPRKIVLDIYLGPDDVCTLTVQEARRIIRELTAACLECQVPCPRCNGTGQCKCEYCRKTPEFVADCAVCDGTGKVDPE